MMQDVASVKRLLEIQAGDQQSLQWPIKHGIDGLGFFEPQNSTTFVPGVQPTTQK